MYVENINNGYHEIREEESKKEFNKHYFKNSVALLIKKVFFGMASASVSSFLGNSIGAIGEYYKILPEDGCFFWKDVYKIFQSRSPRPLSDMEAWQLSAQHSFSAAIKEELLFRGLIQDVLLKKLPSAVIRLVSPKNVSMLDSKMAKIFRITVTAALFSTMHLVGFNKKEIPIGIKFQAVSAFVNGLILGTVKESSLGIIGSTACHLMHNFIASVMIRELCIQNKA